jgi:uncharacterized protein YkwD
MRLSDTGKWEFVPHEGPKRGIGLGPCPIYCPEVYRPNGGPRRGVGIWPANADQKVGTDEQLCLDLVNKFRKEQGKGALVYSQKLTDIGMPHSIAMLQKKVPLGHAGFQQRAAQVEWAQATGENVAYTNGYSDPVREMVQGWIHSPGHRRNLLGDFNQMGIAFAKKDDLWYATQFFAWISL